MLENLFSKPLALKLDEQLISFASVGDFEFALSSKIAVPSTKVMDMFKYNAKQLHKEAKSIKQIDKSLVALLCHFVEQPDDIMDSLKKVDTSLFSQDHAWRDIIIALNAMGCEFDRCRHVALVKYIQYLSARQDIIRYLYTQKKKEVASRKDEAPVQQGRMRDTLAVLEEFKNADSLLDDDELGRMPKGETIEIRLTAEEQIKVNLSKHKCLIKASKRFLFIDSSGQQYSLNVGRNVIGRSTDSIVPIDPHLRDISRLHLAIENLGSNILRLTDYSSYGTYIAAKFL